MYHSRSSFLQGSGGRSPPPVSSASGCGGGVADPRIFRGVDFGEIVVRVSCLVEIELLCGQRVSVSFHISFDSQPVMVV